MDGLTEKRKKECLLLSYMHWVNSWVGDPRVSFEDYCDGNYPHDDAKLEIDFDKCTEVMEDGKIVLYLPSFKEEVLKKI